ncbi:MAG: NAD(P)H-dependent oxidoreductase [Solirubrobacteraceae bacterium]|nr:NAD(P)H-dependent oxidoreductase [Solirubrobacteraceae bacterium]
MSATVLAVIGNPRPESRTHHIARTLAAELRRALGAPASDLDEVDLAPLGSRVLDYDDTTVAHEVERVLAAEVLVVASPTYKATYSGLLKAFLDRVGTGALTGSAVPVLLGGAPNHALAVDAHFTPLLAELGAATPTRGLFVLESQLGALDQTAAAFADRWARWLAP